jgi:hypothetical protein
MTIRERMQPLIESEKPVCHKTVDVRGGAAMAGVRNCSGKVVYTDHQGRGWCKRHEPDDERKAIWAGIGALLAKKKVSEAQTFDLDATPKSMAAVRAFCKAQGWEEELVRDARTHSFYWDGGNALSWYDSTMPVAALNQLTFGFIADDHKARASNFRNIDH